MQLEKKKKQKGKYLRLALIRSALVGMSHLSLHPQTNSYDQVDEYYVSGLFQVSHSLLLELGERPSS